ncbi:MAG TPA: DUF4381 domain-containing protein [Lysobacter sp.]|nr:DUF4381 domain-containing protein [Lysobacter sp.]
MQGFILGSAGLVLRDIHQPPAPSLWPPAPGWWLLLALVLVLFAGAWYWHHRKLRKQRAIAKLFDAAIAQSQSLPAQIAAMSELLRRAARRRDAQADKLQGEAWLSFLDAGDPGRRFSQGAGRLLLEGGFRRDADALQVAALRDLVRERFLGWMAK